MGGMRPNSKLPKANAGRPKGSRNGEHHPGINGGVTRMSRPDAQKRDDPLWAPFTPPQKPPDWADVEKLALGSRLIHEEMHKPEHQDDVREIVAALAKEAKTGSYRHAELYLAYYGGKPVAFVDRKGPGGEISGDQVAEMAAQVMAQMQSEGLHVVPRSDPASA